MVLTRSLEDLGAVGYASTVNHCSLCEKEMVKLSDCLRTSCKHIFHKGCIEGWLKDNQECPNCKIVCHIRDLVVPDLDLNSKSVTSATQTTVLTKEVNISQNRGRGRGSAIKRYNTRSNVKSNENQNKSQSMGRTNDRTNNTLELPTNISHPINPEPENPPDDSQNVLNQSNNSRRFDRNRRSDIDYGQISQMIESTVHRLLSNLSINSPIVSPQLQPNVPINSQTVFSMPNPLNSNTGFPNVFSNINNTAKITTTIQSWNIRFDGSSKGLRCEEFLYRIQCLTEENFNGNFDYICANLHVLLTGKAKDWYWKYHKSVNRIEWDSFCSALKKQYRDYRTTYDIREELHNRKQKVNESFEVFFDAITDISDRLDVPLEDEDLIEIITRNLRPEIRHELLYVQIRSISHLKKLCLMREKLLNEDCFKRNIAYRMPGNIVSNKKVATIDSFRKNDEESLSFSLPPEEESNMEINAIAVAPKAVKCWNCDRDGHYWDMCVQERKVFCYGCGLKNVYKPQCVNCSKDSKNFRNNLPPRKST